MRRRCSIDTMRDVAERAGVSISTVSHVVNETRPVSDELRGRVLAAIEVLGYQPNTLARGLRRGQTHTIGMIVPDSANPFFAEVGRGVEDASFEYGYSVILCNSDGDLDKELMYTRVLAEKRVDGIILVAAGVSTEHIRAMQAQRMPLVVVDRDIPDVAVDSVLTDNARGGELATRHLLGLGHRRIGCIAGPSDVTPSADRVTGYRRVLKEFGLPVDECLIVKGDFQCESGYQATYSLLTMDNPPTAIFACNDMMAIGAICEAFELGWQVPDEVSVVGFDDVRLASLTNPPLTTVAQPKYEMGTVVTKLLIERMRDLDRPARRRVLDVSILVRQSTARRNAVVGIDRASVGALHT
ncbi:MAG: LacI family transcriptional regulator [Anaerolineae bacterium]|nr:LacI family transcriptional regulator [Anaerolineae bacterium]